MRAWNQTAFSYSSAKDLFKTEGYTNGVKNHYISWYLELVGATEMGGKAEEVVKKKTAIAAKFIRKWTRSALNLSTKWRDQPKENNLQVQRIFQWAKWY
jgi:hypothetical protein